MQVASEDRRQKNVRTMAYVLAFVTALLVYAAIVQFSGNIPTLGSAVGTATQVIEVGDCLAFTGQTTVLAEGVSHWQCEQTQFDTCSKSTTLYWKSTQDSSTLGEYIKELC